MTSATWSRRHPTVGARRSATSDRNIVVRSSAAWVCGLLCGFGVAALDGIAWMPLLAALLLAGALLLSAATLRRALPQRRRVLVWEEPTRQAQR